MRIIRTDQHDPKDVDLWEKDQIYNAIDVAATFQVLESILPQLDAVTSRTYTFSRALQGPALEMRLRGVLVDAARKSEVIQEYREHISTLEDQLDKIVLDGVGMATFNYRSHADLQKLFYHHLAIPPIRKRGRPTTDRAAREKLHIYLVARPIINHLNAIIDLAMRIKMLTTEIDQDGQIRTSYNIAGTNTGRFSSSFSEFGTGGNLQNVEESLRSIFIADPGYKFAKFDAKSGESYCVGAVEWNLFNDGRYLDAVESGDIHTAVARICWPALPWTGNLKLDKEIAEQPYYRHYTYRFMCKKLGHGSNYGGQPKTLAEQSKLPEPVVRDFQPKYFRAFPSHIRWQAHVDTTLRRVGHLTTLTGRKRWFFGRRNDPATLREAIAYDPQGSLADVVNRAMLRIWRWAKANHLPIYVVLHDHDALTIMYPEEMEDEVVPKLMEMLVEEVPLANGRAMKIPYDCAVGWNKGKYDARENPEGLRDYKGTDERRRPKEVSIMDRVFRRANK